jgi:hypothetical protein
MRLALAFVIGCFFGTLSTAHAAPPLQVLVRRATVVSGAAASGAEGELVQLRFAWPSRATAKLTREEFWTGSDVVHTTEARIEVEPVEGGRLEVSTHIDKVTDGTVSVPSEGVEPGKDALSFALFELSITASTTGSFVQCGDVAACEAARLSALEKYGGAKKLIDALRRMYAKRGHVEMRTFQESERWNAWRGPADGGYEIESPREWKTQRDYGRGEAIPCVERVIVVGRQMRDERECVVLEREILLTGDNASYARLGRGAVGLVAGLEDDAEYRVLTRIRAVHEAQTMLPLEIEQKTWAGVLPDLRAPDPAALAQRRIERFEWSQSSDKR